MSSLESQIPFTTSEESFLEGLEPVPTSEINFQNVFPSFSTTTTTASTTTTTPTTSTAAILMQFVNGSAFAESINGSQKIDLQTLWKWLEQGGQTLNGSVNGHNVSGHGGSTIAGVVGLNEANLHAIDTKNTATTWQLAIIQGVLLAMLVILSILWAFCCRRMRRGDAPLLTGITEQVVALARKISNGSTRDLPPSYSKVDLTQVGLTINDHFNPPPHYDVVNEEEVSGDTRRHRRRVSRFSLSSLEAEAGLSLPPNRRLTDRFSIESDRPARFSVSSETSSENSGHHSIIRSSRFSTSSTASGCSCGTDSETSSRRTSRVTFAPNLESGPTRRESSQSLPLQPVLVKSRKSSSQSEGSADSRKVSFVDELTGKSARPDPLLEEKLRTQLEIVREAGEMGEFITASAKSSTSGASAPLPSSSTSTTTSSSTASSLAASALSLSSTSSSGTASASTSASTSSIASDDKSSRNDPKKDSNPNPEKKTKKKSFCHLPEDDIKNKELFI